MTVQGQNDIDGVLRIGRIVALVRDAMLARAEPGMTTAELDSFGEALLERNGARSAPRSVYQFPGATCISLNEEAAHGIPGPREIGPGDVLNVDVSAERDGYFADTGATVVMPPASKIKLQLCHATRMALNSALSGVRAGEPINGVGRAVQQTAKKYGFRVIRNLAGHGVGRSLHEEPVAIANYFRSQDQRCFETGQVVAIEPFLSTKSTIAEEADDGWTLCGQPGNLSAQYEHTVIITDGKPIIATLSADGV